MSKEFHFYNGPWENSEQPTIVRENAAGGDPHILATLSRIHSSDELYELCRLANLAAGAITAGYKFAGDDAPIPVTQNHSK